MRIEKILRAFLTSGLLCLVTVSQSAAVQDKTDGQSPPQKQGTNNMKEEVTRESPFACNIAGLSTEQRKRYMVLVNKLRSSRQEIRELADGYAIKFPVEESTIQELAEFITYERLCCPFFDLEMVLEREGGPAWLRLRGRDGVKEFIRTEFGIK